MYVAEPTRAKESGEPNWLEKETFGKVPNYLVQVKAQIAKEYTLIRTAQEQETAHRNGNMRLLTEGERLDLLTALKKKWEHVNAEYQKSVLLPPSGPVGAGQLRRKDGGEKALDQLEKDIARLEKKQVWVVDD